MYLFTRAGRFGPGSIREAMSFVATITEKVHQETGLEVHAWSAVLSPELGTTVWATFVEDLEHLEQAQDKLAVSESFVELAEKNSHLFAGPLTDGLAQVVHGTIEPDRALPSYVSVARAVAANGHLREAVDIGVEIAETATRITGVPTLFMMDATGPYGGCRWSSGVANIAEIERSEAALMGDTGWLELIDRAGACFTQGANQSLYRRIA